MIWNEYKSYILEIRAESSQTLLFDDWGLDLGELKAHETPSRLKHAVGLPENPVDVGAVADSKRDGVNIDGVILDVFKALGVTDLEYGLVV